MATPDENEILRQIFSGEINQFRLPFDLYSFTSKKLIQGVYEGFKHTPQTVRYNSTDWKLLMSLRTNLYKFSAAKTFNQVKRMMNARKIFEKGAKQGRVATWDEFKDEASKIYRVFNENYLAAEYGTTIASGTGGEAWNRFEENKELEPYLRFITTGGHTCDECAPFEGMTAPIDDPIWDTVYPPIHYLCQCATESLSEVGDRLINRYKPTKEIKAAIKKILPEFRHNVGRSGKVFNELHPYFQVEKEYRTFAKNNFGLPIPKSDE